MCRAGGQGKRLARAGRQAHSAPLQAGRLAGWLPRAPAAPLQLLPHHARQVLAGRAPIGLQPVNDHPVHRGPHVGVVPLLACAGRGVQGPALRWGCQRTARLQPPPAHASRQTPHPAKRPNRSLSNLCLCVCQSPPELVLDIDTPPTCTRPEVLSASTAASACGAGSGTAQGKTLSFGAPVGQLLWRRAACAARACLVAAGLHGARPQWHPVAGKDGGVALHAAHARHCARGQTGGGAASAEPKITPCKRPGRQAGCTPRQSQPAGAAPKPLTQAIRHRLLLVFARRRRLVPLHALGRADEVVPLRGAGQGG